MDAATAHAVATQAAGEWAQAAVASIAQRQTHASAAISSSLVHEVAVDTVAASISHGIAHILPAPLPTLDAACAEAADATMITSVALVQAHAQSTVASAVERALQSITAIVLEHATRSQIEEPPILLVQEAADTPHTTHIPAPEASLPAVTLKTPVPVPAAATFVHGVIHTAVLHHVAAAASTASAFVHTVVDEAVLHVASSVPTHSESTAQDSVVATQFVQGVVGHVLHHLSHDSPPCVPTELPTEVHLPPPPPEAPCTEPPLLAPVKAPRKKKQKPAEDPPPPKTAGHQGKRSPPKHEDQGSSDPSPAPRLRKLEEYMALHPVDRVRKAYQPRRRPGPAIAPETHSSGYDAESEDNRPTTVCHSTNDALRRQVLAPLHNGVRRPPQLPIKITAGPGVVDRPDKLGLLNKPKKRSGFCQQCTYEGRSCKIVDCLKHQKLR